MWASGMTTKSTDYSIIVSESGTCGQKEADTWAQSRFSILSCCLFSTLPLLLPLPAPQRTAAGSLFSMPEFLTR